MIGAGVDDPWASLAAGRLREQVRLDARRSLRERNRLGQFATPPALAAELAALAWAHLGTRPGPIAFLDPAVGTGAFFEAWRRLAPPDRLGRSLGVEVDPAFAASARALWGGAGLDVLEADFTAVEPPAPADRFDLLIGNPPYVRHHHLDPATKRRLRGLIGERLGLAVGGLAGLYGHFLLLADAWMADGGLAIWLIPAEFLDVNYGEPLRRYLAERVTLHQVHRFDPADAQFADALVTSAVVVFSRRPPPPGHRAALTFGGRVTAPARVDRRAAADLASARKWSSPAEPGGEGGPAVTLGDLFTIRRGIATGANRFFIRPRAEALALGLPGECLRPILPGPRRLVDPTIEADPDGWPRLDPALALIDCDRPEDEVRSRHPALWRYLASGRDAGLDRRYLTGRRTPWYAQERREPAPWLCSYMGRGTLRFFRNRSDATAPNVYLMLHPRPALRAALDARPDLADAIDATLRAIAPDRIARQGRVYGGGLQKVEPHELARLPLNGPAAVEAWCGGPGSEPAGPAAY